MDAATSVDHLLQAALDLRATDVLLTVGAPPLIRVDHELEAIEAPPLDSATVSAWIDHLLGAELAARLDRDREVDVSFPWQGRVRIRGNAFHQRGQRAMSLRFIPDTVPNFDQLGVPAAAQALAKLPQGLVLVTGPTGSGKSTTLAAFVDWINRNRRVHILTIEDPIEYVHQHKMAAVSQREVGTDSPTFVSALRAALREDPDVVLVGEMRDPESIATTLTLAETGHLVFSTLHTNDAPQTLDRIVDVFPAQAQAQVRVQLASSLTGIICQRLVPRVGGGLVAAYELLLGTPAVRNLVREGKTRQLRNVMLMGRGEGMTTLEQSLINLVAAGVVTREAAAARACIPSEVLAAAPVLNLTR